MSNYVIDLVSIQKHKISNFFSSSCKKKLPCLKFQFKYAGKDLFIFSCIFIDNKPMQYSVSFDSNPRMLSLEDWYSQLTYAIRHFIKHNFNLIGKEEALLYSRYIMDVVSLIKQNLYGELVEPGFSITIEKEPKDIRRILLRLFKNIKNI